MGLEDREYMHRRFFDEEHPWIEPVATIPSAPQTTQPQAKPAFQQGRFPVEVTAEEYERVYGTKPPNDAVRICIEVSRTEYERIYRMNPALEHAREQYEKQLQNQSTEKHALAGEIVQEPIHSHPWTLVAWCCGLIIVLLMVAVLVTHIH